MSKGTTHRVKLTKRSVEAATPQEGGRQRLYLDTELTGFGLIVGKRTKTFIAMRSMNNRQVRVTIGRYTGEPGEVERARSEARSMLGLMSRGINPNDAKRARRAATMTLAEALDQYLNMPKSRSAKTLDEYRGAVRRHLSDWLSRPLSEITRAEVRERHHRIGRTAGSYAANGTMRVFRAVWNRAMKQMEELPICPTINVDWYPERRRQAPIDPKELPAWYQKVMALTNPVRRDYYLILLLTGLRREDAATIRWDDLENGTLHRPSPKGGTERAFTLPLSGYALEILRARRKDNEKFFPGSSWVFPAKSRSGHIAEPKEKDLPSPHRLRDTYTTAANAVGLSIYDIEVLTNHRPAKSSVTAGYVRQDVEHLRRCQQAITDYLLGQIGPQGEPIAGSPPNHQ